LDRLLFVLGTVALLAACSPRPNFIVIYTDDQRWDTLSYMPAVSRLADEGVVFSNSFVTSPECHPSRASLLTGRLASTHGILDNTIPDDVFDASDTIAVRLQEQGYVTALFGKYLNGYSKEFPEVPPGWDEWGAFRGGIGDLFSKGSLYLDAVLSLNGARYRTSGYSTDVLTDLAVEFIEENASREFFLLLSFWAPHVPLVAAERHQGTMTGRAPHPPPSLAEEDISDKPEWLRERLADRPDDGAALFQEFWEVGWAWYLEVLLSVDESVARIRDKVEELGIDDNTVIIFTSDNGFLLGEHWLVGKGYPYEESIRVPLVVWYPGFVPRGRSDALVANIDIAPTLAQLAGAQLSADGSSLVPLLFNPRMPWRHFIPLEEWGMPHAGGYTGFRFKNSKHITWGNGEVERYNLRADPYELENRPERGRSRGVGPRS
jgi:N-acetylglucosamine-6-sulfatase